MVLLLDFKWNRKKEIKLLGASLLLKVNFVIEFAPMLFSRNSMRVCVFIYFFLFFVFCFSFVFCFFVCFFFVVVVVVVLCVCVCVLSLFLTRYRLICFIPPSPKVAKVRIKHFILGNVGN